MERARQKLRTETRGWERICKFLLHPSLKARSDEAWRNLVQRDVSLMK